MRFIALLVSFCCAGVASAPHARAEPALELPRSLATLLADGKWDATPRGFRIVTLSFIADGCAAEARADAGKVGIATACIDAALALAGKDRPRDLEPDEANAGLWLAHYALILGARDATAGSCADAVMHARVARGLARRSLAEATAHAPSFAGKAERYPADQTAVLAALARHDKAHGTTLAAEPAARFDAYLTEHATDAETGLPWSMVAGKGVGAAAGVDASKNVGPAAGVDAGKSVGPAAGVGASKNVGPAAGVDAGKSVGPAGKLPRGCALSWQTRYLAEVLPARAEHDWRAYREHYLVDAGILVGFREWPPGRDRAADIDSGPIVRGVGTAASALAIAAARRMGDTTLALRLEASAATVTTMASGDPKVAAATKTKIAEAIRYLGHVERRD